MKPQWYLCVGATLVILAGCGRGSGDALLGKWTNHHVAAKQPAIVSIEFLPKSTVTINAIDTFAAAGMAFADDVDRPVPSHHPE